MLSKQFEIKNVHVNDFLDSLITAYEPKTKFHMEDSKIQLYTFSHYRAKFIKPKYIFITLLIHKINDTDLSIVVVTDDIGDTMAQETMMDDISDSIKLREINFKLEE